MKEPGQEASVAEDLFAVLETTRIVGLLLHRCCPTSVSASLPSLAKAWIRTTGESANWGRLSSGSALPKPTPVMERLELMNRLKKACCVACLVVV